eukprot:TRINITY_DN32839_c0_g1_i1.p1 TRINITY_DN32839_c0_g1~~TRINITY_DN32839_c0_g1_i1.p1  ORF type:complete len:160 (-),score=35.68 TRINITY_DN32839_c0_g1_i1:28-507(-)
MIRRPPRSTLSSSSAASDVYKRQTMDLSCLKIPNTLQEGERPQEDHMYDPHTIPDDLYIGASDSLLKLLKYNIDVPTAKWALKKSDNDVDTAHGYIYKRRDAIRQKKMHGYHWKGAETVSYTHLRAHETPEHLVCRLLLEKKKFTYNHKEEKENEDTHY